MANHGDASLYLTLDIRACVVGETGGWERCWFYELGPGACRDVIETYRMKRVLCPWYAVFRGPAAARVRITFCTLTREQFEARTPFHDVPKGILFQN